MSTYSGKRIISVLLAMIVVLSILPFTSWGVAQGLEEISRDTTLGDSHAAASIGVSTALFRMPTAAAIPVSTFEELVEAVEKAVDGAVIMIIDDISFNDVITIEDRRLSIIASDSEVTLTAASGKRHFIVGSNAEVTLASLNLVLDGADQGGGIEIDASGMLKLEEGTITNCLNDDGGGVLVAEYGTFEMSGGNITGNTAMNNGNGYYSATRPYDYYKGGGGVYIANYGSMYMYGGSISHNVTNSNGGGVHNEGLFEMADGSISDNIANGGSDNHENSGGGGVYNIGYYGTGYNSVFRLTGGNIHHNEATVANGGGVAVYVLAVFEMDDGIISQNTARVRGGGVEVANQDAYFTMSGGEIHNNYAEKQGGGVSVLYCCTFTMNDGKIHNNVSATDGGGVYSNYPASYFYMNGGEISNNFATEKGGGIYINANATGKIYHGKITGNTAGTRGGGVYIGTAASEIYDGKIIGNTAGTDGGGIYTEKYNKLKINNSQFSENKAGGGARAFDLADMDTYDSQIGNIVSVSDPLDLAFRDERLNKAYNNFDINYNGIPVYTVTFETGTELQAPGQQVIVSGESAVDPVMPDRDGYHLLGWKTNEGQVWDFNTPVTSSIVLAADWGIETFTVTFDANGGMPEPENQRVDYGNKVSEPVEPTKPKHEFQGWYTEGGVEWDFQKHTITENLKLVAHWKTPDVPDPEKYTVTFDADGGVPVPADQTVLEGGKATKPAQPTKEGYIFDGWYNGTVVWDFDENTVNTNITPDSQMDGEAHRADYTPASGSNGVHRPL